MASAAKPKATTHGGLRQVNVHEAKTQLSQLLQEVEAGQAVVIARSGVPIARLVPLERNVAGIAPPGALRGEISIADDFDRPLDDLFTVLQPPIGP
jgi:prevent-host-death family protein